MADRIKIRRRAAWPEVTLAPQLLVNCRGGGSCEGGNPYGAYEYMAAQGVPDESCQNYEARDGECRPLGECETCVPPPPSPGSGGQGGACSAVTNFTR